MKKLKVGILMGGMSTENEVSFNSGRTIYDHLDKEIFETIAIFQHKNGNLFILPYKFLHRGKISDFEHRLNEAKKIEWDDLKNLVDFIYIATHGRYAEDGTLQGMLEVLQIPYLGTKTWGSALSRDKFLAYEFLKNAKIQIPNYIKIKQEEILNLDKNIENILKKIDQNMINFPCVVKPHKEGSSVGITICQNKNQLEKAILEAANCHNGIIQPVIVEEKIIGKEFTCIVITDPKTNKLIPLPPTEIEIEKDKSFFDYEQKYMPGRAIKHTPARFSTNNIKKIQEISVKVMKALEIENVIRVDGFLTERNEIIIIDPNTISGMGPSSFIFRQAAEINMSHTQLINTFIEAELNKYKIPFKPKKKDTQMETKIKVAVLFGGRSNEKEISLESGRNVVYKLSPEKYNPIAVFVSSNLELYKINQRLLVQNNTKEIEDYLEEAEKIKWSDLPKICDFAFIALHGGEGENGKIQGALELLGVPYNGSDIFTSGLCANKFKTNNFLEKNDINTPKSKLIKKEEWMSSKAKISKELEKNLKYPIIIKPNDDGCSTMVFKAKNEIEVIDSIDKILKHKHEVLVEEKIDGVELTVGCIGNNFPKALMPSQSIAKKEILSVQEKFLPGEGQNITPALLKNEEIKIIKKEIEKIYTILKCKGYARIDCFFNTKTKNLTVIEINTLPALTPATCLFHQAAEEGLSPMEFIDKIIELGLENHKFNMPSQGKQKELR